MFEVFLEDCGGGFLQPPAPNGTLAPSVSGSRLGYTWYLVVAVLRDSIGIPLMSYLTARCTYCICMYVDVMVCICQT